MAEWTVTPSEGVINNGNGSFTFPQNNSYCDKDYTVEYSDSGCTCSVIVTVDGKYCHSTYTSTGYGDAGSYSVGCSGDEVTISGVVPYAYTGRSVVNCNCVETGTGTTSYTETETVSVSRNCGSASSWSSTKGNLRYTINQSGGCTEKYKKPVDNCQSVNACSSNSCSGCISLGSSKSTLDSVYAPFDDVTVTGSGNIEIYERTKKKQGNYTGYYKIKYTGSDWNSKADGDYLGSYSVSCTTNGYCSGATIKVYKITHPSC